MPATSIQSPFPIFTDIDGQPLEAGLIWFGTAGNNPISSPITAYWDAALTQVVTQPVTTRGGYPLNGTAIGRLYVNADYSILVRNRSGSDVLSALNATERYDSSLVTFIQAGAGAVTRTVQSKLREVAALSVTDFGAVGNSNISSGGGTDDTSAIQAAIAACLSSGATLTSPPGKCFRITSAIDMRGVQEIDWQGEIFCDNITGSPAITFGGFSGGGGRKNFYFGQISDGGSSFSAPLQPLLRVFGLKNSFVTVTTCRYIELYADSTVSGGTSVAYNQFKIGSTYKLQLRGADNLSWVNENTFHGGRFFVIFVGTTITEYQHNHNVWYFPTLEGAIDVNIQAGYQNRFYDCRLEDFASGGKITFSSIAYQNVITYQYDTGIYGESIPQWFNYPTKVFDSGYDNLIIKDLQFYMKVINLFTLDAQDTVIANGTVGALASVCTTAQKGLFDANLPGLGNGVTAVIPGLAGIEFGSGFTDIYQSSFIPATPGDTYGVQFSVSGPLMRYAIRVYDANYKLLTTEGAGGAYIAGTGLSFSSGQYSITANLDSTSLGDTGSFGFAVRRAEVKYIKIYVLTGSTTGVLYSMALFTYQKPYQQIGKPAAIENQTKGFSLPTIPTHGFAPQGEMVSDTDGSSIYICTFSYETTLNGALAGGATSVTVSAAGSISNGDIVGILLDNMKTHWSTVSGLAGATFTVAALPSAAASGNRVVFNRWATK